VILLVVDGSEETVRPPRGLCDRCRHQRIVRNTRGSAFSLCERSREDPAYMKYPPLPVLSCPGFRPPPEPPGPPR